ncbi:MAG: YbjQ family protein [Elusimicrobiota bacterium]|jgi:uncharacterized protein YbjQ (UPF0145 family)|nr:YbjQ family protein [Elusimicrobiota bacterium]
MDLLILLALFAVACITGGIIERSHFRHIKKREIELLDRPYISFENNSVDPSRKVAQTRLVSGNIAIGGDYFKNVIAGLKSFFGGRIGAYEPLLDRARREALLRMRESAPDSDIIINVRIDSVNLNSANARKAPPRISVFAYGTAVTYEK